MNPITARNAVLLCASLYAALACLAHCAPASPARAGVVLAPVALVAAGAVFRGRA